MYVKLPDNHRWDVKFCAKGEPIEISCRVSAPTQLGAEMAARMLIWRAFSPAGLGLLESDVVEWVWDSTVPAGP